MRAAPFDDPTNSWMPQPELTPFSAVPTQPPGVIAGALPFDYAAAAAAAAAAGFDPYSRAHPLAYMPYGGFPPYHYAAVAAAQAAHAAQAAAHTTSSNTHSGNAALASTAHSSNSSQHHLHQHHQHQHQQHHHNQNHGAVSDHGADLDESFSHDASMSADAATPSSASIRTPLSNGARSSGHGMRIARRTSGYASPVAPDSPGGSPSVRGGGRVRGNSNSSTGNARTSASSTSSSAPMICRYFNSNNGCNRGERCHFAHVQHDGVVVPTHAQTAGRSPALPRVSWSSDSGAQSPGSVSPVSSVSSTSSGGGGAARRHRASSAARQAERDVEFDAQFADLSTVLPGQLYELCRDQYGCRYLQRRVEAGDTRLIELVIADALPHLVALMTDPLGNYLCQKLIECATPALRRAMLDSVRPSLVSVACHAHGTRAVQKLVECVREPEGIDILRQELQPHVLELTTDLNGNHVIQRCLAVLSAAHNQFVYDAITFNGACVSAATHRHGCCVLQRCIDHATPAQYTQLVDDLVAHLLSLVQDPFGNYVVQYALDGNAKRLADPVARVMTPKLAALASQKYSSNVVEKLLRVAPPETKQMIIGALINADDTLAHLLQDPYGNYVVQTALALAPREQRRELVATIAPHLSALRNTTYGKRIHSKIARDLAELGLAGAPAPAPPSSAGVPASLPVAQQTQQ
jgi:hypothetical protein